MIHINRLPDSAPAYLTTDNKGGRKETAANIEYADNREFDKFKFKAYSNFDVKQALIKLFKSKCAYCESKFLHVYSGDVEHFRPKGEIDGANPPKPGYYWLAAEWDNLLLSCRNCNQKLKHKIHGEDELSTMGKMNQFPLSDNRRRARSHNNPDAVKTEDQYRLLLDPCKDIPEEHLEFDETHGIVKGTSPKGKMSIEVFVLQRMPLVQARKKLLIDIQAQIQRVTEAVEHVNDQVNMANPVRRQHYDRILRREMTRLRGYLHPNEEFTGMAKQVIDPFLEKHFGIVAA